MTHAGADGEAEDVGAVSARAPHAGRWLRTAADRVPTKWLGTIGTVVFLSVTAAFGGLAAQAEPAVPELTAGETFTGAGLEMSPVRALLTDELSEAGVSPHTDERVLALIIDVTNIDTETRPATSAGGAGAIRLEGHSDQTAGIARDDDGTLSPYLQPGVPARLILAWTVDADDVVDGDEVRIVLPDATRYVGSTILDGVYWDDVIPGAYATLEVTDLGSDTDGIGAVNEVDGQDGP